MKVDGKHTTVEAECHFEFFSFLQPRDLLGQVAPKGSGVVPVDDALWAGLVCPLPCLVRPLLSHKWQEVPVTFSLNQPIRQRF